MTTGQAFLQLEARRRERAPQALARIAVLGLFVAMWLLLWVLRIPMPEPFLLVLLAEIMFLLVYWRVIFLLPDERGVRIAHGFMLAAEIVFHTTMVYFLGGIMWLGAFAYVFGLIFTNTFLDLRGGFAYTAGAAAAFSALIALDATGTIPHYTYLSDGALSYQDSTMVVTTTLAGVGVFFSIYLWVNWVGHQLRSERDHAIEVQAQFVRAQQDLERANAELEMRVQRRTFGAGDSERRAERERGAAALDGGVDGGRNPRCRPRGEGSVRQPAIRGHVAHPRRADGQPRRRRIDRLCPGAAR